MTLLARSRFPVKTFTPPGEKGWNGLVMSTGWVKVGGLTGGFEPAMPMPIASTPAKVIQVHAVFMRVPPPATLPHGACRRGGSDAAQDLGRNQESWCLRSL